MKERVLSGKYNVVILDEVCVAIQLGMLDEKELLDCFAKKPEHVEIVCTGRGASKKLIKAADLVTEMRAIKHYFNAKNVKARKGIEF
jgi:cob(I)alamin adenosyltransferase